VLVLRALGLGDLLTAVPALRALRRDLPGHDLVLAAPGRLAEAAAATGVVDRLLPTEAPGRAVPTALPWSGPGPDLAVDLHGNGPPSHLLLQRLRPGRLLAYAHPGTPGIPGPVWREDEHERDRWCRLLTWYGIPADPADLSVPLVLVLPPYRAREAGRAGVGVAQQPAGAQPLEQEVAGRAVAVQVDGHVGAEARPRQRGGHGPVRGLGGQQPVDHPGRGGRLGQPPGRGQHQFVAGQMTAQRPQGGYGGQQVAQPERAQHQHARPGGAPGPRVPVHAAGPPGFSRTAARAARRASTVVDRPSRYGSTTACPPHAASVSASGSSCTE
jgi:hypothetical protein